jgi:hypothetical protein
MRHRRLELEAIVVCPFSFVGSASVACYWHFILLNYGFALLNMSQEQNKRDVWRKLHQLRG